MLQSAFAYFRATALLQAHDLKGTPAGGINVDGCGDRHLMGFEGFATPERNLIFDINDFDETLPAPFEWDMKIAPDVETHTPNVMGYMPGFAGPLLPGGHHFSRHVGLPRGRSGFQLVEIMVRVRMPARRSFRLLRHRPLVASGFRFMPFFTRKIERRVEFVLTTSRM